ncbi:hypothetical protein [Xanthomonas phage RTH11]|nr:hypothetical protein [Xanthomonas phage RTH11]
MVFIGGRTLTELIRGTLEKHIGHVADIIDAQKIVESLLEEFFYGGSLQDDFYEQLAAYRATTHEIEYARKEILASISQQVQSAIGIIWPSNHYSFEFIAGGDLRITETRPTPVFKPSRLQLVG